MSKKKRNPSGYWTEERVREEALKCKTKKEFKERIPTGLTIAKKLNIYDEICANFVNGRIKYTDEEIKQEALNYKTRNSFRKNN